MSNVGILELPKEHFNSFYEFCKFVADHVPEKDWILRTIEVPFPIEIEGQTVAVRMDRSMAPVLQVLYLLGRDIDKLEPDQKKAIATHIGKNLPKLNVMVLPKATEVLDGLADPIELNMRMFFSAAYEALIMKRVNLQKVLCEFIEASNATKSPDLICRELNILIECKDSNKLLFSSHTLSDVLPNCKKLLLDAIDQLKQFDKANAFDHFVFIDLPEKCMDLLKSCNENERKLFLEDLMNLPRVNPDGTKVARIPMIHPLHLILTSFDFGHIQVDQPFLGHEPVFFPPAFSGRSTQNAQRFVNALFPIPGEKL